MRKQVHVAAAVIRNSIGEILLAKRPDDKHQGGLWEFPGGKVEPDEPVADALQRELHEELGIDISSCEPLIQVPHHYPDKSVFLDVFVVDQFSSEAWGKEGQEVRWVPLSEIESYEFPAANRPILDACLLPSSLAITPPSIRSAEEAEAFIASALESGAGGCMLRLPRMSSQQLEGVLENNLVKGLLRDRWLTVNTTLEQANSLALTAVHLTSERLRKLEHRQAFQGRWLSASCHNADEIKFAIEKGVDFITLSPLQSTTSHPEVAPMGWRVFQELVGECPIPVYALGGLQKNDLALARNNGAQGIAAISAWLD